MSFRKRVIDAGFGLMGATRLHKAVAPFVRGVGAILMFHHVRPASGRAFAPNGPLEITPAFLDATIRHVIRSGYDIVTLDEALARLGPDGGRGKPFVVLTFDDGYRNNREHALPVLERHGVPGVFYITTGLADRTARLWWVELEEVIRQADRLSLSLPNANLDLDLGDDPRKRAAFDTLYWALRGLPEPRMLEIIAELCSVHGVVSSALVASDCMDWGELEALARHPLVTIGAHTLTHPMLAKHPEAFALREMAESKAILEQRLGRPVRHLAYPVGDPTSAGTREFALARRCGYASAVTTRPGLLFADHAAHATALPRVSVNGDHQRIDSLDILLSGAAFALWNRGRRLNVA